MKDWREASGEPGDGAFSPVKTPLILSNQEAPAPRAAVEEMDRACSRRRPPQTWNEEEEEEEEVGRKRFEGEGGSRSPRRRIIFATAVLRQTPPSLL